MLKILQKNQLLFIGIIFVVYGIFIINNPVFVSPKYQRIIDIRPFEWSFGLSILLIGIIFLFYWSKNKKK